MERAVARIDLGAVRANCGRLRAELGEARLCAVVKADGYGHGAVACAEAERARGGEARLCAGVKADGYGHGAVACAEAALAGGASALAVATAAEAAELAAAG